MSQFTPLSCDSCVYSGSFILSWYPVPLLPSMLGGVTPSSVMQEILVEAVWTLCQNHEQRRSAMHMEASYSCEKSSGYLRGAVFAFYLDIQVDGELAFGGVNNAHCTKSWLDLLRQANHELSLQGLRTRLGPLRWTPVCWGFQMPLWERKHEKRFAESSSPERPRLDVGPSSADVGPSSLIEDSFVPLVISATENVMTPLSSGRVTVNSPNKAASHSRDKTRARSRDRVPSQSSSYDNKVGLAWAHEVAHVHPDIPREALQSHVGTETAVPSCTDVQRSIPWPDTSLASKWAPTTEEASDGQEHVNGESCCGCYQRDGRDVASAPLGGIAPADVSLLGLATSSILVVSSLVEAWTCN